MQSLIAAGLGMSLLPALALGAARRDDVAVLPVAVGPARTVELVLRAADRRPPAVDAAVAALRDAAAELTGTGPARSLGLALAA